MTAMNFLTKYGVIIPSYDILGSAIFPRIIRESNVVREHTLSGITYEENVTVDVGLRIYVQGQSLEILKNSGAEIKYLVNAVEPETDEDEEEEKPRRRGRAPAAKPKAEVAKAIEIPSMAYVEYVFIQSEIEKGVHPIVNHPRFERLMKKEEHAERLSNRLRRYADSVANMGSNVEFESDQEPIEEDEAFGGSRLSQMGMQAQIDAHRRNLAAHRDYADKTLDWLETNILQKSDATVEALSLDELTATYGGLEDANGPLFTADRILTEIGKEILSVSLSDVD